MTYVEAKQDETSVVCDDNADYVFIKDNLCSALIYSGNLTDNNASKLIKYLNEKKICYLDCLILQNYSYTSTEFCEYILDKIKVKTIMYAEPLSNNELELKKSLTKSLSQYGTTVQFYSKMDKIIFPIKKDLEIQIFNYYFANAFLAVSHKAAKPAAS